MRSWAVQTAIILVTTALLAGCGSSSSSKPGATVAQVTLGPAALSLVAGQVAPLSFQAFNSSGAVVSPIPTFTFNTSNPKLVTVGVNNGQALACGGVWDSAVIVCNGNDSSGKPLVGTATITASAGGVSSAPIQVSVHPAVTSIQVTQTSGNTFPGCTSNKQTAQFTAKAFNNGTDITNLVGAFSWTTSSQSQTPVVSVDANGLATAQNPGLAGIIATLGNVSSPAVNFKSCLPVQIILHLNGDPAGMPTESVDLSVNDTKTIQADMIDENNMTFASVTGQGVAIFSNNTAVASVSGTTLTGISPGGAGLVAVCAPPNCGGGLATPIYSNLFGVAVNGTSPATTVYATSSFPPPTASPTPTILPIDTSKTPPAAGTAINMPCPSAGCAVPNSMVFAASGSKAFLGTSHGLASLDPGTNTVTLLDPFVGKVLAVSPDGTTVIESNAANDPGTGTPIQPDPPSQRVVIVSTSNNSVQTFVVPFATAAAFTSDGSKAFVSASNGNFYVLSSFATFHTFSLGGSNADVTTLASGPFAFFANSAGLETVSTCNNAQPVPLNNPPTHSLTLQALRSFKNADVFVALDSTGVDIETAIVTHLTPPIAITQANCAPPVAFSNQFIDFGIGAFTANQLLVGTNLESHIVVLPKGNSNLLVAIPGASSGGIVPLASGATEALSGGMTLDGNVVWVGVAGKNSVDRINLTSSADDLQISTSFQKSDGTAAPPNIVAVRPK